MQALSTDHIDFVSGGAGGISPADGVTYGSLAGGVAGLAGYMGGAAGGIAAGEFIAAATLVGGVVGLAAAVGGIVIYHYTKSLY